MIEVCALGGNAIESDGKKMHSTAYLDLGGVLPSSPEEAKPTEQDVCISTEADGLHRVRRVAPTPTVTYNITHTHDQYGYATYREVVYPLLKSLKTIN